MLLHIISRSEWDRAQAAGQIAPDSLASEGFVHCSYADQVLIPANARYPNRQDLLLLVLDPGAIPHRIVEEDSDGSGSAFPHVYGPIPVTAVIRAVAFPPGEDGTFSLPAVRPE